MNKKKIRLAIIGLGSRGSTMLKDVLLNNGDIQIVALSDKYQDNMDTCADIVTKRCGKRPRISADYREFLQQGDIDAAYIASSWETHTDIAIDFLKAGISVGLEVGGSDNIDELWTLVDTCEKTGTPFMFMENCCYDKYELMATHMARDGIFGEIVHCSGAYGHDLRSILACGIENKHYRLQHYIDSNSENYPTHELGPLAKILNINRGNRMLSLISVASKAAGMEAYIEKHADSVNPELLSKKFKQGDIVDTIITCENGATIRLKLDTTLPRFYDREIVISGTKAYYKASLNLLFKDGDGEQYPTVDYIKNNIDNAKKYEDKYLPDYWKNITEEDKLSGHGGMDGFMFSAFINALKTGDEMPIDVYDAASWMSITCLSAQSIQCGGAPVQIPDFTRGKYKIRPPKDVINFGKAR